MKYDTIHWYDVEALMIDDFSSIGLEPSLQDYLYLILRCVLENDLKQADVFVQQWMERERETKTKNNKEEMTETEKTNGIKGLHLLMKEIALLAEEDIVQLRCDYIQHLFHQGKEINVDEFFYKILVPQDLSTDIRIMNVLMKYKCRHDSKAMASLFKYDLVPNSDTFEIYLTQLILEGDEKTTIHVLEKDMPKYQLIKGNSEMNKSLVDLLETKVLSWNPSLLNQMRTKRMELLYNDAIQVMSEDEHKEHNQKRTISTEMIDHYFDRAKIFYGRLVDNGVATVDQHRAMNALRTARKQTTEQ